MKVLIVAAHPEPTSFSATLARIAADTLAECGHDVMISDLYARPFNPVGGPGDFTHRVNTQRFGYQSEQMAAAAHGGFEPELAAEIERLRHAEFVLLNFPMWWFGLPAILKGWVDRVFAMGVAYAPGQSHGTGPLLGKRAMLSITTGAPAATFADGGVNGNINTLLFPIQYGILHFAGMDVLPPFVAFGAARCTEAERECYLRAYVAQLRTIDSAVPLALTPERPDYTG